MPPDPQVQTVLDKIRDAGNPEYWQMSVADARAWHVRKASILDIAPSPVARSEDRAIPGKHGPIPLRSYWPRPSAAPLPVLVWLHGGGHVVGSLDSYDALCRMLCSDADCIVVSVDYRLAPEHKFPAGVDDSFAALAWLSDYPGMVHPFFSMGGAVDAGRAAHREAVQAMRDAFGTRERT